MVARAKELFLILLSFQKNSSFSAFSQLKHRWKYNFGFLYILTAHNSRQTWIKGLWFPEKRESDPRPVVGWHHGWSRQVSISSFVASEQALHGAVAKVTREPHAKGDAHVLSRLAALATIVGYYVFRSGSYSLISHWWQGSPLIWFFITYWGAIDWCRPFVLFYVQLSPGLGSKMELEMLCQDNSNNHLIYDQNRRFSKPVFTPAFWMRRLSIWHPSALFWFWVPWSVVSRVYIT